LAQGLELVEKGNETQYNFPFGYSGWQFWSTSQDIFVYSRNFPVGQTKLAVPFTAQPKILFFIFIFANG